MVRCITCNVFHTRKFCKFLYCLAWSEPVEFNRLPCPNNEMYGDAVFAIRFQYQLAIFGMRVLIWLSRLLHAHIAYEINSDKTIAAFFRISDCFLDLIHLNSVVSHDQTTRYTMMRFLLIDSTINWLCLEFVYWYGYLDFFHAHIAYLIDTDKIIATFFRISYCLLDLIR